jgi:phospholipase/carboxylesterase
VVENRVSIPDQGTGMKYTQHETEFEVTLAPAAPAVASVILLHGLGADGRDFVPIVGELGLSDSMPVRFVFPHAPLRPVTISGGYVLRAWYDIKEFTPAGRADRAGLADSSRRVAQYIADEKQRGIATGRIVLAGFSQGGAVALYAGLRYPERLAGVLALSCYLPFPAALLMERSDANRDAPILLCHGRQDPVVHIGMGLEARDELKAQGYSVEWHEYPMQHEVCAAEIADVARWLKHRLAGAAASSR